MIKIAITGKADKRILAYPFMRACSIAGRTSVITDDMAYKRLYAGTENQGVIEEIKINILPLLSEQSLAEIEEQEINRETEYLIYISDTYYPKDAGHVLMLCEYNSTFMGTSMEDIIEEQENITFGTLTLTPRKNKSVIPKGVQFHQIIWKPEYSIYLFQTEELRQLQPLKDKLVSAFLVNAFAGILDIKPATFYELLKRKRYAYTKKDK